MNAVFASVVAAYLYALPALLIVLGLTALRRDRLAAWVPIAVGLGFVLIHRLAALGAAVSGTETALPPGLIPLWPAAVIALGIRLTRDRRQGHVRSTVESLAVLGSGAILLAALLSLPAVLSAG